MEPLDNNLLAFVNAGQLMLSLIATFILFVYVDSQIVSWRDFVARTRKSFDWDFQGGGYDWSVAVMVIFLGNAIRSEASWEYRTLGTDLRIWQMSLGVIVSIVGLLCLIRVMVPAKWFPACWIATIVLTLIFCVSSALIA